MNRIHFWKGRGLVEKKVSIEKVLTKQFENELQKKNALWILGLHFINIIKL